MANNYTQFSEEIEHLTEEETRWLRNQEGILDCNLQHNGESNFLWVNSDSMEDMDKWGEIICEFLGKFRPGQIFTLEWADICSKLRIGEFGGGLMTVTANGYTFVSTGSLRGDAEREFKNGS